jgi:hypothetical protein
VKNIAIALGLLLAFATAAMAGPAEDEFAKMDKNKDGKLSKKEFVVYYPVGQWQAVAKDKRVITITEWVPVYESVKQHRINDAK